jgi:DNA-binding NarL/FixJ family response regulator
MSGARSGAILRRSEDADDRQTVAIVADRHLSVAALSALLLRDRKYVMVREARGLAEVARVLQSFRPTVVVVETSSGRWSLPFDPGSWGGRTLLLTDPEGDQGVSAQAVRGHANGYISRSFAAEAFAEAVATLREAGTYLDRDLVRQIQGSTSPTDTDSFGPSPRLSPREWEILVRIANGRSTKEVAREYAIAPKTVSNHIINMYQKLKLRHRGQLVVYAAQHGLITL